MTCLMSIDDGRGGLRDGSGSEGQQREAAVDGTLRCELARHQAYRLDANGWRLRKLRHRWQGAGAPRRAHPSKGDVRRERVAVRSEAKADERPLNGPVQRPQRRQVSLQPDPQDARRSSWTKGAGLLQTKREGGQGCDGFLKRELHRLQAGAQDLAEEPQRQMEVFGGHPAHAVVW